MQLKLSCVSLSISALLMLSVMATTMTTVAYAAISGDTDLITIDQDRSYCNNDNPYFGFGLFWRADGFPDDAEGYFLAYLESSDGKNNIIGSGWGLTVTDENWAGGGIEAPIDYVGQGPYTLTVYEATGPTDPAGSWGESDLRIKEGGYSASVTFSCADLEPIVEPEPETPLTERFKNQGQCVSYANAHPDDEDVTKELCQEAFTNNRRSNRA